jgi:hypothetical protein
LSTSYAEVGLSGLPPIRRFILHDPHARVCLWFDLISLRAFQAGTNGRSKAQVINSGSFDNLNV